MTAERRIAVALRVDEPFPHHHDVLSGVLDYARTHPEWRCVVDEYPSNSGSRRHRQGRAYDGVIGRAYDGVIGRASPEIQRRLARLGIPLANVWYEHASPTVPGVYPDTTTIGRSMADHLINRGYRRLTNPRGNAAWAT